jgi:putative membrane protein
MSKRKSFLGIGLRGMAMGVAEIIPGVSGGTIALITGIYERLLQSIRAFGPIAFRAYRSEGLRGAWTAINGPFLIALGLGMAAGLVVGVFGVTHILENYPPVLWAFFFGLIVASVIYLGRMVSWSGVTAAALLAGAAIAYGITVLTPAEGSESLLIVFGSGILAISAMLLPGISGSFVLLLLGMYTFVIGSFKGLLETGSWDHLKVISVFALGCVAGVASFSRLLTWLLHKYTQPTLALLTGFLVGSLNKIWPWQNETVNVLPGKYEGDSLLIACLAAFVIGFFAVFAVERFGRKID